MSRDLGLDPLALLRREGLDPGVLRNPDARMPASAVAPLLEAAAAESGRTDFGLRLAEAWSIADLGPVSLALVHQDTLREALGALELHRAHISDAVVLSLREDARGAELHISLNVPRGAAAGQLSEFMLGRTLKLCRAILGPGWLPQGARFRRFEPQDLTAHRRLLGSEALVFGAEADALLLRPGDLDARLPRMPDPALRRHAEALIALLSSASHGSIAQRAASLIRAGLPHGGADLHHVAGALGLNGRTLQRRLRGEGLGFSDLLDQVRSDLAQSYLADRQTPMHQIAARLGYADGSAFTRWFTQTFGEPPSRWRERNSAGEEPLRQRRTA
ncbi:MAG: AraC family transcriptional regulator ligand-binding domain-containing protein [Caulobacteraceae bacterium]